MKGGYLIGTLWILLLISVKCKDKEERGNMEHNEKGFRIHQFFMKEWSGATVFETWIYLDGQLIKTFDDNINQISDSLKAARLQEAKDYIEWVKKFGKDTTIYIK